MLSKQDNDYLCRVGPGTPMGDLFRQYWLPAIRSDELPGPDCPPLRLMLLGEPLIAFRITSGTAGIMQNSCPHRGASMFFGRNEEEGLRCVYHGWKFDVEGNCVDMPSEPVESNFKTKVHARAYKTHERGGIIWAYMGNREVAPPLPDLEANLINQDPERILILQRKCNWMQGLEGELDTIHAAFLHWGTDKAEDQAQGSFLFYHFSQRANARFVSKDTEFGAAYGCYRPAEADSYYWRTGLVLFPFYAMQAQGELGPEVKLNAYVPMDDDHTLQWEIFLRTDGKQRPGGTHKIARSGEPQVIARGNMEYLPHGTGWFDRYEIEQNAANDYKVDREKQKAFGSYSGIPGIRQQDMAVTESMGTIYQRHQEHLGTSDSMIIRARRRWINAAKALREQGVTPPGVDNPEMYRQRSGEVILPRNVDWWDGTQHYRDLWDVDRMTAEAPKVEAGGS